MWEAQGKGIVYILSVVPWWLVFIGIAFLSTGMVLILRFITEGKIYDKARSSTPGDLFLAGYCAMIAETIQTTNLPQVAWIFHPLWHSSVLVVMALIAIFLHFSALRRGGAERRFTLLPAQKWHNLFVVPLLGYAIFSTLPIVYYSSHFVWIGAIMCLGTWIILVVWDITHGNMVQIKE